MAVGSGPAIGAELGGYRLEALVGRGGMSAVYRAEDLRLGRRVALKFLAPELAQDARFRERFLAESRLAASLDHANIVPIFEAGETDGLLYIAMRYVEATDMRALLRAGGLDPPRAIGLVAQLADALDAAHARGLVHRDVKPSNALVAVEGAREHVYLADFGLTKHATSRGGPTATGQMVGTVDYVAPEQIRGEAVDGRADLYSLGCVLYECLTGEVPFPRGSEVATIYAHLEDDPPRPSERGVRVPTALDAVVARAMAKDPARRWQTGAALAAAARAALPDRRVAFRARRIRRPSRPVVLAALGLLIALAAAVGALLATGGGDRTLPAIDANAVAVIDPSKTALDAQIPLGSSPSQMAVGDGAVWVTTADEQTVSRIDTATRTIRQTRVGSGAGAIALSEHGVWVVNNLDGTVSWISPVTNQEVKRIPVGNRPSAVCVAGGAVWVANADDRDVVRLDAASGRLTRKIPLDDRPTGLACGGGSVWASSGSSGSVAQISADRGGVERTIATGRGASAIAYGANAVWVANTLDDTVSKIDPLRGTVVATVTLRAGDGPAGIAVGRDGVWVSNEFSGTVARIDPRSGKIVRRLRLGNRPHAVAVVGSSVWVGLSASGAGHRGGTLHILTPATFPPGAFDPDNAGSVLLAQVLGLTNDGLTALRRTSGVEGEGLVPDLAVALPRPTDGGRTYVFQLHRGIRYSNGAVVRPSDIRRQLERVARLSQGSTDFYAPILGEPACVTRRATCSLKRGIVVDDGAGTITFHLRAPDPDFLYKLALPLAVAVPPGTPPTPTRHLLPATGPYMIVRYQPGRLLTLARNPRFRQWSPAAKPDGFPDAITIRFGVDERAAVREVETGAADWVSGAVVTEPQRELEELFTRYAGQVHANPQSATVFFFLNTRVPPFDNLDARRAVNYAVDRRGAVAIDGGPRAASLAACQILPPNFPVYRPYCPYTRHVGPGRPWSAPDLAKARRLVARSGTKGMRVTVWSPTPFLLPEARFVRGLLSRLGYRASLRVSRTYWQYIADSRHRAQIGPIIWASDYPAASDFLWTQFSCAAFAPRTPSQANWSEFCDRAADRLMRRARRADQSDPSRAAALWARAERRIVDRAAALPLTNPGTIDVVSPRVGNYQYNPQWGILLDQLWLR